MIRAVLVYLIAVVAIAAGAQTNDQEESNIGLPSYAGELISFLRPTGGQKIVAGDSITIELSVPDSVTIDYLAALCGSAMYELASPYVLRVPTRNDVLGEMTLSAIGKTAGGEMVTSEHVAVELVSGGDELLGLRAPVHSGFIGGVGCAASLYVKGEYSSGAERELPADSLTYTVTEGVEIVHVARDGAIVGLRAGRAKVLVRYQSSDLELEFRVGDHVCSNNEPLVVLPSAIDAMLGEEACLAALDIDDYDTCIGDTIEPANVVWTVEFEHGKYEGNGYEFCFTPEEVGYGIVKLEVSDMRGGTSLDITTIEVR